MKKIELIQKAIKPVRQKLINHDLYRFIETPDDLRLFTQYHIYAVWDFMSLAKALQQKLSCVNVPWLPSKNSSEYTYLINDIVLAEESDINIYGQRQSHFEMYIDAMKDLNGSTEEINKFLEQLEHGTDIFLVISASDLPKPVKSFLIFTFNTIFNEGTPEILSAFTFGREDLIPDMFTEIIGSIQQKFPKENIEKFKYYFDRHIEIDADEHGPMALKMIESFCGDDLNKWKSVENTALKSLEKRLDLWDFIKKEIMQKKAIA
jgi:hypothetical protein